MLRLKSAIRLTREEGQIFETLTGQSTLQALPNTTELWRQRLGITTCWPRKRTPQMRSFLRG